MKLLAPARYAAHNLPHQARIFHVLSENLSERARVIAWPGAVVEAQVER
jgi:hypothetical protein